MKPRIIILISLFIILFETTTFADVKVIRGEDRVLTSVKISEQGFYRYDTAILTTAYDFPDATAGIHLAKSYKAPILLNGTEAQNSYPMRELVR